MDCGDGTSDELPSYDGDRRRAVGARGKPEELGDSEDHIKADSGWHWRLRMMGRGGEDPDRVRTVTGDLGPGMRFIRVSFLGWPSGRAAGFSEIAVGGE